LVLDLLDRRCHGQFLSLQNFTELCGLIQAASHRVVQINILVSETLVASPFDIRVHGLGTFVLTFVGFLPL